MPRKRYSLTNDVDSVVFATRLTKADNVMLEQLAKMSSRSKIGMIRNLIREDYLRELEVKNEIR